MSTHLQHSIDTSSGLLILLPSSALPATLNPNSNPKSKPYFMVAVLFHVCHLVSTHLQQSIDTSSGLLILLPSSALPAFLNPNSNPKSKPYFMVAVLFYVSAIW